MNVNGGGGGGEGGGGKGGMVMGVRFQCKCLKAVNKDAGCFRDEVRQRWM